MRFCWLTGVEVVGAAGHLDVFKVLLRVGGCTVLTVASEVSPRREGGRVRGSREEERGEGKVGGRSGGARKEDGKGGRELGMQWRKATLMEEEGDDRVQPRHG